MSFLITGHNGTIDGQGQGWWKKYRQRLLNYTRGPLVQIMWSSDILISNVTLRDSPFWTLHPFDCKNITIRDVTVLAPIFDAPNTDGIDPGECFPLCSFPNKKYKHIQLVQISYCLIWCALYHTVLARICFHMWAVLLIWLLWLNRFVWRCVDWKLLHKRWRWCHCNKERVGSVWYSVWTPFQKHTHSKPCGSFHGQVSPLVQPLRFSLKFIPFYL